MKPVKRNKFIYFLFLSVIIFFAVFNGCAKKNIDEDTASKVYVEVIIVQETYSHNMDSLKTKQNEIFQKYNIPQEEFEKFLQTYQGDEKKWNSFFKKADDYMAELKSKETVN